MESAVEILTLVGTFMTASVWMMRSAVQQQKLITDRFIKHLETMLENQEAENRLTRSSIAGLAGAVRKNSQVIKKLSMKL